MKKSDSRYRQLVKLDKAFSRYVRLRDVQARGVCVNCGAVIDYFSSDCGHYIPRKVLRLRWDERNAHAECRRCNRFAKEDFAGYAHFMYSHYGEQEMGELLRSAREIWDPDGPWMEAMTALYERKGDVLLGDG